MMHNEHPSRGSACRQDTARPEATVLILGAGVLQAPLFDVSREMGLLTVAVDSRDDAPAFSLADFSYTHDLADFETCLRIAEHHNIAGVIGFAVEYPLPTLARLCKHLGIAGPSPEAVRRATDKTAMRQAFAALGVPSPLSFSAHTVGETVNHIKKLAETTGHVILKPAVGSGGRGVTQLPVSSDATVIADAFERALSQSRSAEVLVEEYVSGPEFSVEAVTWNGHTHVVAVTDKETSGPPYFVEIGHSQPSQASSEVVSAVAEAAVAAVAALGIDWCGTHTEVRYSLSGPRVIETAARFGGGSISSHLTPLSTGVSLVQAAIDLALGLPPDIRVTKNRGSAIRFLRPNPGVVLQLRGIERACAFEGVVEVEVMVQKGDMVPELVDGTGRVGHVLAEGTDAATAIAAAEKAREIVTIKTEMAQSICDQG
jgi:biotin carboxylase